jgi:hypothetical protein
MNLAPVVLSAVCAVGACAGASVSPTPTAVEHRASARAPTSLPSVLRTDPDLAAIAEAIPTSWTAQVEGDHLVFTYRDRVCVESTPSYGIDPEAPPPRCEGRHDQVLSVSYRLEPRWSKQRYQAFKDAIDSWSERMRQLPQKHGIAHLATKGLRRMTMYRATTPDEKQRVARFERERDALRQQMPPQPTCSTADHSLFRLDHPGESMTMHLLIEPMSAHTEYWQIQNIVREHCVDASPYH